MRERDSGTYWERLRQSRLSRRRLLTAAGRAGIGATGLALVGCGDDDDDAPAPAPAAAAVAQTESDDEQAQAQAEEQAQAQAEQADTDTNKTRPAREEEDDAEEEAEQAAPAAAGGIPGGTFTYPSTDGSIFDPAVAIHGGTYATIWSAYDRLSTLDGNYRLTSAMAELPEVVDGQTFIYNIKPNVSWHDVAPLNGRQFTADDAAFGLQRFGQDNPEFVHSKDFDLIDSFEVVDELTLRLGASAPFAPLLNTMGEHWALMVSRDVVEEFGDTAISNEFDKIIGTGPFMADTRIADAETNWKRNPNWYRGDQPYFDGTRNIWFSDSAIQMAAFISGQIDLASSVVGGNPADLATVQDELGADEVWGIQRSRTTQGSGCHFNVNVEPYDDPRVRLALHLASNREQLIAVSRSTSVPQTLGGPVAMILKPYGLTTEELAEIPGYRSGAAREEDVSDAQTLLESTGIDLGNLPSMTVWAHPVASNMTQVMQSNWAEIGFDIELEEAATSDFLAIRSSRTGYAVIVGGHSGGADPDFMHTEHHTEGGQNYGNYSDPTVDDLLTKGRTTFDTAERKEFYDEAQRYMLTENPPRIFAGNSYGMVIGRSYVKNFSGVATYGYMGDHMGNMWFDGKPA